MKVELTSTAKRDFNEAFGWYRDKARRGVARKFNAAVNASLAKIAADPLIYARTFEAYRVCLVNGFPYAIVFKEDDDSVVVRRIVHTSRDTDEWQAYLP